MIASRFQVAAERAREAAAEVLARREFRQGEASWLERKLRELLEAFDLPSAAAEVGWIAVWTLGGLAALLVGWLAAHAIAEGSHARRARADLARGAAPAGLRERVAELRARAEAARAAGDLVLALRLHFAALVLALGTRGELEYSDAWTNRELLARGRPSAAVLDAIAPLVEEIDRKGFGGDPASEEDVERVERLSRQLLGDAA